MLIRTHHLILLGQVLREAGDNYRLAFGARSAAALMFTQLAALVARGGEMELTETPDEEPKAPVPP